MSCHECGFCQTDLSEIENRSIDARARGNFNVAALLESALENCGVLRDALPRDDRQYLKNVSRKVERYTGSDMATTLLRDAKEVVRRSKEGQSTPCEPELTRGRMGFGSMFAASRGGSSTPTPKRTEPECHSNSGFIRMLDESKKGTDESKHVIERVIESAIPRHAGFGTMLDASRRGTFEGDEPEPQTHMLDTTSDDRPHLVRRGMGFANMLEASGKGTFNDQDDKPRARRGMGFGAMLDGAARGTE
jgi:hypothetical protein